ncbi:hypothetical protein FRACA_4500002 [Frankia canadensis]|uniref:Uncharacterized protein n=1 Tax=Frankia canadensis TaxID=1836972 RepID=A0A2I2KXL1_9ACTN|nr:hypothetical protein FRACA_4500002 [Frankia canadensis]SOU57689.1 hypothetical protein FRACA_4500002 [Frankia canadensis]
MAGDRAQGPPSRGAGERRGRLTAGPGSGPDRDDMAAGAATVQAAAVTGVKARRRRPARPDVTGQAGGCSSCEWVRPQEMRVGAASPLSSARTGSPGSGSAPGPGEITARDRPRSTGRAPRQDR